MTEWRRIPRDERPYDAYRLPRYIETGCDHAGPYCKCDPPWHLRPSSPIEEAREAHRCVSIVVEEEPCAAATAQT